jgi:tetratricopeptide (TPR) repeat protein
MAVMRLLHLDGERPVLTDFRGKTVPSYAILSHRWSDSEVLYEDLAAGTYKEKGGYRKIEFCAAQAAQDGLQYFWIDTCCIDKWNRRERSKAINSMFRWYKNAARCYVFLLDVSTAADASESAWRASFLTSEWFTRGWTLQELIAPVSLEFFSCEGQRIGNKTSLEPLVHETTGVPVRALRNGSLDEFTIDERRDWAKNRETSEEEDAVYCLLGILDITIPAVYGEGVEKAWRRLQTELEAAGSAPSIIPFSQNEQFVGRESQLAELEAKLFKHDQAATMAIVGPPGTGKSQLALEVAHRTRQRNHNWSVFWVDASDADSLYRSYAGIAQKLGIPDWDDEKADTRQLVKAHLSEKGERQCLLVFDNADNVSLGSAHLSDYVPQSEQCAVLYTTTNSDTVKSLAAPNMLQLREMTPSTAQRMLESHLQIRVSGSEQQEAQLLLHELSYLPLAIVQATAYINIRGITLKQYRSLTARQKEAAPWHDSESPGNRPQEHDIVGPVATTLLIALDQLHGDSKLAIDYLFLAACVDRKDIPLDLLPASSPRERDETVKVLGKYRFVTRRPAESSFDLHQLVHRALRGWLRKQERLDEWMASAIRQLYIVFPCDDLGSRSKWRRLLPHARYTLTHSLVAQGGTDRLVLEQNVAMALYNDGRWKEAEQLEMQMMARNSKIYGEEHPDTLSSMANLGIMYSLQGKEEKAELLKEQVIETLKMLVGDEDPSMLTGKANLAATYKNQGRWKEAEQLDVQVMETRKRVLGDEHPDTLTSMINLASTYRNQGRRKEAEQLEVKVMKMRLKIFGDEHPSTLTNKANLASTYRSQGRWKEAEQLEMQVLEISSRVLGDEHPDTLTIMANLASTYRSQERWKEAEQLEVQVMEVSSRVLGDEHPDTLTSINNLASTFSMQERWREAEQLQTKELQICLRVMGNEHPSTLTSMNNLAFILKEQGLYTKAVLLLKSCCRLQGKILGSDHPQTVSSLEALQAWGLEQSSQETV